MIYITLIISIITTFSLCVLILIIENEAAPLLVCATVAALLKHVQIAFPHFERNQVGYWFLPFLSILIISLDCYAIIKLLRKREKK